MKSKKFIYLMILIVFLAISQVSASDLNESDTAIVKSLEDNDEILTVTHSPKNFTDLESSIENAADGDSIELNGTYYFDKSITVNKAINIYGVDSGATLKYDSFSFGTSGYFNIQSSNVILNNLKITGKNINKGAVICNGNNTSILNCEFISFTGSNALYINGKECTVKNCTFQHNKVTEGTGGAIKVFGDSCIINNSKFIDNEARAVNASGGAILLMADDCLISNCAFTSNYCNFRGGGIAVFNKNNRIVNSTFLSNYVTANSTDCCGGGAIFSNCTGLNISNCMFKDNKASNSLGGAIVLGEYNNVGYSTFIYNSALVGNSVYSNATSYFLNNEILLAYLESEQDSIVGNKITQMNNIFNITKMDSKVTFSAGMVFEYASSGKIHVIVYGGSIKKENIRVLNHPEAEISFSNNILTVSNLAVGKYTLRVTTTPDENHYSVDEDLTVTVNKATAVIKASKVTVALKKGTLWTIKLVNSKTGKAISNMKLTLKVFTGKKYKTVSVNTNSKGIASYQTNKLSKGKHKVIVSGSHAGYNFNQVSSSIKVIKPKKLQYKTYVKNAKDGSTVSVTVLYKKKPVNGIKVRLYVYTGKKLTKKVVLKSKTKEKNKGVCGWATNKLSVGTHKIIIKPVSIKYKGSKNVKMKIKKSAKKYTSWETKI